MPAILTENGFIDTKADAKKLEDSTLVKKLGRAHAEGVAKALGLKKKTTAPKPTPKPKPGNGDYIRVEINGKQQHAFKEKTSAANWFKDTIKVGDTVNIKR